MNPEFQKRCCAATCAGTQLLLHPEKVAYWPSTRTLLVADVHLGKEYVFGRAGSPVPAGPSNADIDRLSRLINASGAERLLVLGDLIHSMPSLSESWLGSFSAFLDRHAALTVEVVAGNHDKPAGQDRLDSRITWYANPLVETPFVFQHEPGSDHRGHVLCGHVHPCYRIVASRKESVRAPVFWFGSDYSVLPAFGQFTGGYTVKPKKRDRLFIVGPECVLPVFSEKSTTEKSIGA